MSSAAAHPEPPELVIEAGRAEAQYWRDLFRYRELFYFLAWRDVLVRYKQTVIGVLWAVLRPFLTMVVFVFVFGKIAKLPTDGVPYPVMVFAAMLPWQLFATSLSEGSNSLITNSNLISKVYFPRLIVPASAVIVSFVDFAISCALLGLLMLFYQVWPGWHLLTLPLFILLALVASTGAGLWLAALNVEYRDFRYVVPFIVQFGLYISPVGFSSAIVPEKWRLLYSLNPMVGVIDGFRWAISGGVSPLYLPGLWISLGVMTLLLVSGVWYFRKMERTFADVI
ncbi:MAG: ABC transporter permease [Verrucomicrobia bacterium]|nr:ABC transporter permease [Verrucomicrobiota bacterium]